MRKHLHSLPAVTMTETHAMNDRYNPVDCGLHSEYELAIMHHDTLQLTWHDTNGTTRIDLLQPTDLCTRNGAEFLQATGSDGTIHEIRLDRIRGYKKV